MDIDEAKQLGLMDCRDLDEHNPWQMSEELDKRFTIDEILEVWYSVYGEDMAEPKFIDELRQRLS